MVESLDATRRDPVFEFDYVNDPLIGGDVHEGYWRLKETAPPLFWTPANGGHWVLNSTSAINHVLRHPETFTSRFVTIPATTYTPVVIPTTLDPPEHRPFRQLLRPFFESKAIEPLETWVVGWANRLIDRFIDDKRCEFVDAIASRLPVSIFMEFMGLPLESFDEFRELVVSYFSAVIDMAERARHADTINGHLVTIVEERRREPKDDLVSKLLQAEIDGRPLSYDELMSICFNMFVGGLDTVVNAMSFGMRHLARDEALRQRIIENPGCIDNVVEELLRLYSFVNTRRYVTQDTEVDGVRMKVGDPILVPLMMIGWDERMNQCPHQASVDRGVYRHGAFGTGIHTCLGIHLARLELKVMYRVWFERIGHFRLADADAPLDMRAGMVMAIKKLNLAWD